MKVAPVLNAIKVREGVAQILVHTDFNMSEVFFSQLGIPASDANLFVGPVTHARQTAEIMTRLEGVLLETYPDIVLGL